ncbi:hypothetical protein CJD36_016875 [Flavipsychrobacter stenotrophus]|uniref:Restriction endonuclease n=1 Tax=Flavipsychrobacter stenotrophus TaxID=2077091 RepID=A0A2S7SRS4_9BACT|nr:hypothetical protein [Flavipsychrobacter stenotrophus]PQJ09613.1 hypothetical protein CJD36_016875 [Flavipsychrobacter stenotrophus]
MELFTGKISGKQLEDFFTNAIEHQKQNINNAIQEFEMPQLFNNWRILIRSIDEIINIPYELKSAEETGHFLELDFDLLETDNINRLNSELGIIRERFGIQVAERLEKLCMMSFLIHEEYQHNGFYKFLGNVNLSNAINAILFFQSRRLYYVAIQSLIPKISQGKKRIQYSELLNHFQPIIDSNMVGITSSYQYLLQNESLTDFEMTSDGLMAGGNFAYTHLEGFFTEPERLSLLDQLELRPDIVVIKKQLPKSDKLIFSFSEVANTMLLFEGAFDKYQIDQRKEFIELNSFFLEVGVYIIDDFDIVIPRDDFNIIATKYPKFELSVNSSDYFAVLNSFAPFQEAADNYHSTIVFLARFAYRTLSLCLLKNKTFQINSGFIFEHKISEILTKNGFNVLPIKRIKRKEFDLITTKNGKVYNFQCKNNFLDITKVGMNYKKIGRLIKLLCTSYEKALVKEAGRETLIKEATGINDIEHFVVSRFPVITRNQKIINFNDLENRLIIGL